MYPLGIQLYSVRAQIRADRDRVLRRLAELGYRSVEPYEPLDDPAGFRAVADDLGLTVPTAHGPVLSERRDEVAQAAHTLGVGSLVVPAVPATEFADAEGVARTAERLSAAAAWAAGHGLRLGYHNHWWEFAPLPDGRSAFETLAAQVSADVFWEVDVYWAATAGVDVPALLRALGDRVRYLHVKDGPARPGDPMTAVGAGTLPIPAILAAAPPGAGRIVELDECATDVFAALADSVTYLNAVP
jgi:sugar phosphate isomerase/epimerase